MPHAVLTLVGVATVEGAPLPSTHQRRHGYGPRSSHAPTVMSRNMPP